MLQLSLFGSQDLSKHLEAFIVDILEKRLQPSAAELLQWIDQKLGLEARWDLASMIARLAIDPKLERAKRQYLQSMIENGSLAETLRGTGCTDQHVASTIDNLLLQSQQYRSSKAFQEIIDFMGRFRDYAPYNNMLVRLQNPSCTFYATARDWLGRFERTLKEDARPMLILAPMHPVMLVYELDQTEGETLPKEVDAFATFRGNWNPGWLSHILDNTKRHRIRVNFKPLSSTHGGFATIAWGTGNWKMRIAIHDELDEPSRFGVLCHELAHVFLGHLGTDQDNWWPSRTNLERDAIEVEAEAVAYVATSHLGLMGSSVAYVSRHLKGDKVPAAISLDLIAKVAGKIERMAKELIPTPRPKKASEKS